MLLIGKNAKRYAAIQIHYECHKRGVAFSECQHEGCRKARKDLES